jgi:hypothetical protein
MLKYNIIYCDMTPKSQNAGVRGQNTSAVTYSYLPAGHNTTAEYDGTIYIKYGMNNSTHNILNSNKIYQHKRT